MAENDDISVRGLARLEDTCRKIQTMEIRGAGRIARAAAGALKGASWSNWRGVSRGESS